MFYTFIHYFLFLCLEFDAPPLYFGLKLFLILPAQWIYALADQVLNCPSNCKLYHMLSILMLA